MSDFPTITLYGADFTERGYIADPTSLRGSLRFNALSTMAIEIPADHMLAREITTWGARITVDHLGERIFSGPFRSHRISSGPPGTIEVTFEDDLRLLWRMLAWPNPSQPLTNQKPYAYDRSVGAAETVLKDVIRRNLARPGWSTAPITIAPDLGRGEFMGVINRFHPIAERTMPKVELCGLGVTVVQQDSGLVVDVYEPSRYPMELMAGEDGALESWSATQEAPSATRVIAGGQGEGINRAFHQEIGHVRESEWSDIVEVFVDSRQTENADDLVDSAKDALAEGHEKTGIRVTLIDTPEFRYGGTNGIRRGDLVTVNTGLLAHTDVIREANVVWDSSSGFRITPILGEITGDTSRRLMRQVVSLARRVNRQEKR